MERRTFIRYVGTLSAALTLLPELISCEEKGKKIRTKLLGAAVDRGHLLRGNFDFAKQFETKELELNTLIVGGGISGLSSAYHLNKAGITDFMLFELNDTLGGNSNSGKNEHSAFPLGAHYLSLANPENSSLISFLKEYDLIIKEENGLQWYNEDHLCHAPDERLLFKGLFHDGLVPEYGVSEEVHQEITRFFDEMKLWKHRKSENGVDLFNIPISQAENKELLDLDKIRFDEWLDQNNYKSEELRWFLDYCCRDDYGAGSESVSAWAGLHYFAGRKATPGNTEPTAVLTWAEGNGFLADLLQHSVNDRIKTSIITHEIVEHADFVEVKAYDIENKINYHIKAKNVICAIPSYVAMHVLQSPSWPQNYFKGIKHNPWLVGIVVLDSIPEGNGTPLAWDNVKFGTKGLGYVSNRNQEYKQHIDKHVISVYLALDKEDENRERKKLFAYSEDEMMALVIAELEGMHPGIQEKIESIAFQRWGHGMVTPYPGSLAKYHEFQSLNVNAKRVLLAHTDYSSYSVFEEAFDLGLNAANQILKNES